MANTGYSTRNVKTWWSMEAWNGSAWITANAIPSASITAIEQDRQGTTETVVLADGSQARTTLSNLFNYEVFTLHFHNSTVSDNLITQFNAYLSGHTGIRITTHTADKFEGFVINIEKIWIVDSGSSQEYGLDIIFQQLDVDASGSIND